MVYGFGAEPEELPDSWILSQPQLTPSVNTFVNELERVNWTTEGQRGTKDTKKTGEMP